MRKLPGHCLWASGRRSRGDRSPSPLQPAASPCLFGDRERLPLRRYRPTASGDRSARLPSKYRPTAVSHARPRNEVVDLDSRSGGYEDLPSLCMRGFVRRGCLVGTPPARS